jgi:hypothetical protein
VLLAVPAAEAAGDEMRMAPLTTSADVTAKVSDAAIDDRTLWGLAPPLK